MSVGSSGRKAAWAVPARSKGKPRPCRGSAVLQDASGDAIASYKARGHGNTHVGESVWKRT